MNLENLRNVEVPEPDDTDRLASVRGRIKTAERRRAAALAGGTVAGFVAIAAVVLTSGATHRSSPAPQLQESPSPVPTPSMSPAPSATPSTAPSPSAVPQTFTTQWHALPAAPSMDGGGVGIGAYGVWTGHELVDTDAGCCAGPDSRTFAAYDPTTDAWRSLATFPGHARSDAAAAALGSSVYLVGGSELGDTGRTYDADAWRLDLGTDSWKQLASMPSAGAVRTLSVVGTRLVAVVLGEHGTTITTYDPATGTWSAGASLPAQALTGTAAISTGTQLLLYVGATGASTASSAQLLSYDPATDAVTTLAPAPVQARQYATGVYAQSAHAVIVWGGATSGSKGATGGAAYDVASKTWKTIAISPLTSGPVVRSGWTGSQMIVSSYAEPGQATTASISLAAYDPADDTWAPVAAPAGSSTDEGVFSHGYYSHLTWTGSQLLLTGGIPETRQGGGTLNFSLGTAGSTTGPDTTDADLTAAALTYTGLKAGQATLSEVVVSTIDPTWAAALITGNPDQGGPVQPARIGFHRVDGTWKAVNIGAAVLCNTSAPAAVVTELTGATCK